MPESTESAVVNAGIEYKSLQGTFIGVLQQVRALISQGWFLHGSMVESNPNMNAGAAVATMFRFVP